MRRFIILGAVPVLFAALKFGTGEALAQQPSGTQAASAPVQSPTPQGSNAQQSAVAPQAPVVPAPATVAPSVPTASSGQPTATQIGVRRDPKGIKGISPFWETLNKADRAYVARDYDAALATFANAIKLEPHNAMGHYRIGEVYLAKGMVKEAEAAWQAAVRYGDNQPVIKAKALFVLADLKEREREWDGTTSRWKVYQTFVRHPSAKGYPATAADRIKRVAEWRELEKKSAEVKERIERRLKEAEAKAQESAKVAPR